MAKEQTIYIPKFSYPFKKIKNEKEFYKAVKGKAQGNYLFSKHGLWHGGIHTNSDFTEDIKAIASGEIVAYKINSKYLQNKNEKNEEEGVYSTGFILIKHYFEYPKTNKLTFFSLYMHMADKSSYAEEKETTTTYTVKSGDSLSTIAIQYQTTIEKIQEDNNILNPDNITIGQKLEIKIKNTTSKTKFIIENPTYDSIQILPKAKKIKAGDNIGLVGVYTKPQQKREVTTHLEVFTKDDIKEFSKNAKVEYAKDLKDKPKPKKIKIPQDIDIYNKKENKYIKTKEKIKEEKIYKINDIKIIESNKIKYIQINEKNIVLYKDCEDIHPITFNWARIIDIQSDDNISIFNKISNYIVPSLQSDDIQLNSSYEELFELIDKDNNNLLDVQEIQNATKDKLIKETTSKYIVKHSSEWDDNINMADIVLKIYKEHKDEYKYMDRIEEHYAKQKERISELSFFNTCKGIPDFPKDDMVYHINPIGLIGEFINKNKLITKEMLNSVANGRGGDEELLKYLNEFAEIYEVNTKYKIAHFLSQIAHESSFNITSENLNYSENRMKQIFACTRGGWNSTTNTCLITHRKRMNIWNNPNNYSNNPQNLANYVYSSRLGNGNESSGDGYRYRGRGLIQLTGRNNYQMFTNTHNNKNIDDQQNFIQNPDLIISNKKYGVESAFIFWESRNINDRVNGSNVREITLLVNGGTNGLIDRETKFNDVLEIIEGI